MGITVRDIAAFAQRGERFAMVTAYDYPSARLVSEAGLPLILVGDSLGMVCLGLPSTVPVTMADILHHLRAVVRGADGPMVVADMPFGSYQAGRDAALGNAIALLKAGAAAVKLEGGDYVTELVADLVIRGIPVMGHLGLTPQSVHTLGGYRVQGREADAAQRLLDDALALERAGAFAVVLEGIPADLGETVSRRLTIPTIGIGAGPGCDGQVLVFHDMLGLTRGRVPTFVRRYAEAGDAMVSALRAYAADVRGGAFPDEEHSYQ
jgi:3-methyl-2-oxobutanoate hydroxymethyltransferase